MNKKKLLLHTCCAPCATVPIERLQMEYEITCFFYNPNIHPQEEYDNRLAELKNFTDQLNIPLVIAEYDVERWMALAKGFEDEPEKGKRCTICFTMRLNKAAEFAQKNRFSYVTTTLTVSPHKNSNLINQIGRAQCHDNTIQFLEENFKKQDGYKRSLELSRDYNLYRQNYCGCVFSHIP
jgi:predicted adenine nucleotide alpha hydrolase (AANH) superfamily ATPase